VRELRAAMRPSGLARPRQPGAPAVAGEPTRNLYPGNMQTVERRPVNDAQLARLARLVPDMLCIAGADGYFHWVSPHFVDALGFTEEEILSTPFMEWVHPDDLAVTSEVVEKLAAGETLVAFENRRLCADGTYRWLEWNTAPAEDGTLYCCARDITGRRAQEHRLREQNRLLEMSETLAGVGHWRVTLDPPVTRWSPEVFRIHGLDPDSDQPPLEDAINAYHPDDREMVGRAVEGAIARKEPFDFEARVVRPGGEVRHVVSSGVPETDESGEVVAIFGVFRDVTDERLLAETLRRTERMASLGTMAAGIAHEINNPLGFVLGNLELLREELVSLSDRIPPELGPELLDILDNSFSGARRIRKIVEGMRSFSHIGTGETALVDLSKVVIAAAEIAQHQVQPVARLVRQVEPTSRVEGDESQLTQVLVNLLVNAAQAIHPGDADRNRVEVTLTMAGEQVELSVADTGPGVPDDLKARIFDPFFTTKPVGTGTGLGLSVCHSIVTQHGGTLGVEDRPGGGCLMTIRLPVASRDRDSDGTAAADGPPDLPRILVVDDEARALELLRRALRSRFRVTSVDSGQGAIDVLSGAASFDVVLCDLMMPTVSGVEVHNWIMEHRPELLPRFVIATGGAFTPGAAAFLEETDVRVIRKPFEVAELRTELAALARPR
jgi:PAS domain S-box-containing protein